MLALCEISKESFLQMLRGELTTDGGAIRYAEGVMKGKIKELPCIASPGKLGELLLRNVSSSAVGTVSSVVNNVQTAYLQKSVNEVKKMSEEVLAAVNKLSGSVSQIKQLSYMNAALSGATFCASVAGDIAILHKLTQMENKISELCDMNQKLMENVRKIQIMICNEKESKFDEYCGKLVGYIDDMRHGEITDHLLRQVYSCLMEVSAFLQEMYNNFCANAFEINPSMLFQLAKLYYAAASLYLICFCLQGKFVRKERIEYLEKPMRLFFSQQLKEALYNFYYEHIPGIPMERDLYNHVTLPLCGFMVNQSTYDVLKQFTLSNKSLKEPLYIP